MSGEFRLRASFSKVGQGAWLSHLEVMRTLERTIRRAGMPYAVTQGFHPHLKFAVGPALPVGTAADYEYFDLWLTEFVEPDVALAALQRCAPPLVPITAIGYVASSEPSLSASLTLADYRVVVVGSTIDAVRVGEAFTAVRSRDTLEVVQKGKTKVFDPPQCIPNDATVEQRGKDVVLTFTLRIGQQGSLRPEALIRAVYEESNGTFSHLEVVRTDLFSEPESGVRHRPL